MSSSQHLIVYDWNGTLLDDASVCLVAFNAVMKNAGYPQARLEQYRGFYDMPIDKFYANAGVPVDKIESVLTNNHDVFHDTYEPLADKTPLRQGAQDLLAHCHAAGIAQQILSNHLVEEIKKQLRRLNIAPFISDVMAIADREEHRHFQPKGEKLRATIVANDLNPKNIAIVGDTPEEIRIAHELGLIGVAINNGHASEERLRAEQPDHLIAELPELEPILKQRGFLI